MSSSKINYNILLFILEISIYSETDLSNSSQSCLYFTICIYEDGINMEVI